MAVLASLLAILIAAPVYAEESPETAAGEAEEQAAASAARTFRLDDEQEDSKLARKKDLGITFGSAEGPFRVNAWLRGQFRFSDPFDSAPLTAEDYADAPGDEVEVRRGRIKVEGHLFSPNIGFYYEHELTGDHPLLDLRLNLDLPAGLFMRVGQYKVLYNRERVDSSGKQQFVERSISTYAFTVDRQVGATLGRRFAAGTTMDSWIMLSVNKGNGRGGIDRRSGDPMYVARWNWQFLGEELSFSQSDLKFRDTPASSVSFAASRVRGPFTRFSSSGGGQLDGFEEGGDRRYTLQQYLQEFAWHYNGMSIQQEFHIKDIEDHEAGTESDLYGGYVQFGKLWEKNWFDRQLAVEGAFRVARVTWDTVDPGRVQDEITLVTNLFLNGHNNKLSAEISDVRLDSDLTGKDKDTRFRLQWDVSF